MRRIISIKEFFSTIGLGLWQAVCYVFRVFNPNNKTKFWRVIWAVFAVCIGIFTLVVSYEFITKKVIKKEQTWNKVWLSKAVYVYNYYDDTPKYIRNYTTGEKISEETQWFQVAENGDEMVVFCEHGKRGYFNKYTGELIVAPKYDKAWIFSEEYAAVCSKDSLFFIDKKGKEYYKSLGLRAKEYENFLFKNGLCAVRTRDDKMGIIKPDGTWVLAAEYKKIERNNEVDLWEVSKDGYMALYDDQMKEVFGGNFAMLEVVDADHIYTMPEGGGAKQRYNLKGELQDAIVIYSTSQLTYSTDKLQQVKNEGGCYETVIVDEIATCLRYFVGAGYNGLMTKSGKIVTPAIYNDIEAIGKDLYRCEYDDEHSVILNSQGQKVNR